MDALISVIVPIYNVEKYLKQCIESIINQTYKNIEILLIDDGSTDNCGKICDEYEKKYNKIKVFHKENGGLSDARNYGIERANGDYITFIDSDDNVTDDYVEYLYNLICKYDAKMSIASYSVVSHEKVIDLSKGFKEELLTTEEALRRMLSEKGFTVSSASKMFKKEILDDIRFPYGKLCEDNGTIYKAIMKCDKIPYGNKSIYNYYKRENSIMTSKFNKGRLDLLEMVDNMSSDIIAVYPDLKDTVEKKQITSRFSILRQMLVEKLNEEEKNIERNIEKYVKDRKKEILKGKQYDKRDKFAMISLLLGRKFFAFSWKVYCKIKY